MYPYITSESLYSLHLVRSRYTGYNRWGTPAVVTPRLQSKMAVETNSYALTHPDFSGTCVPSYLS